ncbi:uncharacterized protein LOC108625273 isoform X1 [Ceratina calcarata]|uniref:Uncharacterized protein LOC108625273 isoform X1 n=1 Tax=Ceratina calcarata TaxID=156304 RepID=A0AAJ7WBQ5_9HYME|nr:uncharacterized protein LOC108625273 isoform X1 [Ceratina calcarata]XP_026669610.1 uncharacterized protein LOC108625273 isoform X1 [Ceratina calcarata]XP_026669611.1 uncharacterized protein LOC108625273 isoform X1 [Ceratina calcarata]
MNIEVLGCNGWFARDLKRRHSWSSEVDHQSAETEAVATSGRDSATLSPDEEDGISYKEHGSSVQTVDLVADCPLQVVTPSRSPSPARTPTPATPSTPLTTPRSMGQRPSTLLRPKISLTWVLRGQQQPASNNGHATANGNAGENGDREGLSRDSKERSSKKSVKSVKEKDVGKENVHAEKREKKILHRTDKIERTEKEIQEKPVKEILVNERSLDSPLDKQSEKEFSGLKEAKEKEKVKRTVSEPSLVSRESTSTPSGREKHRHRRTKRSHKPRPSSRFGYEIADIDAFLTKASIEKPANIPVVLSFPSVLYQTQGGTQDEMALPLGTVVNAVFKNQTWLYVQTPHGQEGYVGYAACLPLGILPQPTRGPCWEDSTDVFPRPLGNMTDTEKLRDTRSECGARGRNPRMRRSSRDAVSTCGERSVDRLYLRAAANARTKGSRHTLLVIRSDYEGQGGNALSVSKGDVVALLSDHVSDWFWVRSRDGREGFIPAVIAGHGFL